MYLFIYPCFGACHIPWPNTLYKLAPCTERIPAVISCSLLSVRYLGGLGLGAGNTSDSIDCQHPNSPACRCSPPTPIDHRTGSGTQTCVLLVYATHNAGMPELAKVAFLTVAWGKYVLTHIAREIVAVAVLIQN